MGIGIGQVAEEAHGAVPVMMMDRASRPIDRQRLIGGAHGSACPVGARGRRSGAICRPLFGTFHAHPALGVDDALWNTLAVLLGQLFRQRPVLHKDRAAITRCQAVLVVGNGRTGVVVRRRF